MRNKQIFLDPQETFEHYEHKSRPTSSQSFDPPAQYGRLACEYRGGPQPAGSHGVLACEYRGAPAPGTHGVKACDYRAAQAGGKYRIEDDPLPPLPAPKITTYLPESNKKKVPLWAIVVAAISVPTVLIICFFGAVWLQELGML